jgi:hypothetical protein
VNLLEVILNGGRTEVAGVFLAFGGHAKKQNGRVSGLFNAESNIRPC